MSNERRSILELVIQHTGQVFPLPYETITIGRSTENQIVVDDPHVSPEHARLSWHGEAGVYFIEDLDSDDGSYVNERRIEEPQALTEGDVVRLGNTLIDVGFGPAPEEQYGIPPDYETDDAAYKRPVVAAIVVVLLACVTIACLAAMLIALAGGGKGSPHVVIQSPADGARIFSGNEALLQATASGAKDITLLEMNVDGALVASSASSSPGGTSSLSISKEWSFETEGKHVVSAVAYTANGKTSKAESVSVEVVAAVAEMTPTPTPTPADTTEPGEPTNTPEPTATVTQTPEPGETVPPPPRIEYFQASPASITAGGCATLQWGAVSHATEVTIEPDIGGVATPGSELVCPMETTTYVLTATGSGGQTPASTTITVVGGLPDLTVDSITFDREAPMAGQDTEVRVAIRNKGEGAAGAFNWEWQAGSDAFFDGRVRGMSAGETKVVTALWTPAQAYASLSTEARVDTSGEVAESDEGNNTLTAVVSVVEGETEPTTVILGSEGALDGYWTNDGVGSSSEEIYVGNGELLDGGGDLVARGFVSFDLSSIAEGATVEGAELRFFQGQVQGDPYGKLGNLLLDHVRYGDSLGDDAYDAPAVDTVGLPGLSGADEWYVINDETIAIWVEQDLVAGKARFQLRLRFMEESDGDGEEDWIAVAPGGSPLSSRSAPRLTITYMP